MDKKLDAMMFAVNEKANNASKKMNEYRCESEEFNFYKGQFQAYTELYSMMKNTKDRL